MRTDAEFNLLVTHMIAFAVGSMAAALLVGLIGAGLGAAIYGITKVSTKIRGSGSRKHILSGEECDS